MMIVVILVGLHQFHELSQLIQPIGNSQEHIIKNGIIRESLRYLGCPEWKIGKVTTGITIASDATGISRLLISSLLYTESNWDFRAVSSKGYVGIGQTDVATMIYPEVDILHTAMKLQDKLRLTNYNMFEALAKYKGGNKKQEARNQAQYIIKVYNNLIKRAERG